MTKKFCKKVTIFIVGVIFGVVGVLWIIGYRYYTVFIESGIILAELLQLVAICHNMILMKMIINCLCNHIRVRCNYHSCNGFFRFVVIIFT